MSATGRCGLAVWGILTLGFLAVSRADDEPGDARERMSDRIDVLLAEGWEQAGVKPAPVAGDAEFLRRATLDLTGLIPTVSEVRGFLADARPDKRNRLIDSLVRRPGYATHLANTYRDILVPTSSNFAQFGGTVGFRAWLRGQLADNVPYDRMVRNLLTASGTLNQNGPELYYIALELKPEELASSTSRIFLGVQIGCAQCHNHPFDHWKKDDFWGYAAFFGRMQRPQGGQPGFQVADAAMGEVKLPGTETVVAPRHLGGDAVVDIPDRTRRQQLADWMTAAENPYFARAAVNRAWAQLFGRGLVDPVDDLGAHNKPSHPELLDEFASYFVASGFDLRRLYETIAKSQAYRLSSEVASVGEPAPELFARMAIKSLSAEQIYDCLAEAMRRREAPAALGSNFVIGRFADPARQSFLLKLRAPTQKATEFQAGIPQALTMMNGVLTAAATDPARSDLLAAIQAPYFSNQECIDILFLSVLSRLPSSVEQERFAHYVETGGPTRDRQRALSDVLWALLNSAEFVLNH